MIDAVKYFVKPGQTVAELGSQLRGVSISICESLQGDGKAVLLDVPRKPPKNRSSLSRIKDMRLPGNEHDFFPDVATFQQISCLDDWKQGFLDSSHVYNVMVLDVNSIVGNDLEITSLSIAKEFSSLFEECGVVLIKSAALNVWAARLIHGQKWIDAKQSEKGDTTMPPHVIGTVGVQEYRSMIPYTVGKGDAVLEVGCHLGTSTALLHEASDGNGGYAIGVDVGPKIIEGAKKRYPNTPFSVGDAWKVADLLRIQAGLVKHGGISESSRKVGFDVIFVDVGGLSGRDGLLEALMLLICLINGLEPRCIVIKSQCVRRTASSLVPFRLFQKNKS
eukprot:CAMPEP_0198146706 /NCGR_PEP_ID=MMETSP1443-20131203/30970_1 /TAXON_ID=186043 /ORGANISM="Entomoneis sp., Strain CCMP2396" /LENGTH=333 /DNA_ID=CAMNT_0043810759 /DNA_START=222 /DNA_END=1226 /DNA_ORIENTATION=-